MHMHNNISNPYGRRSRTHIRDGLHVFIPIQRNAPAAHLLSPPRHVAQSRRMVEIAIGWHTALGRTDHLAQRRLARVAEAVEVPVARVPAARACCVRRSRTPSVAGMLAPYHLTHTSGNEQPVAHLCWNSANALASASVRSSARIALITSLILASSEERRWYSY